MFVQPYSMVPITIRGHDMAEVIVHFGRCLPIIYVRPTQAFGEQIKSLLGMSASDAFYFDATSKDERIHKLTFLIDNMTDEQRQFLRQVFPGDKMVKEIDQKIANEILVRSTPSQ
ncbi:sentrin-specific protease 6, partial [Caerostris darwini]